MDVTQTEVNAGVVKPPRKPRAKSAFVLLRLNKTVEGNDVFDPLGVGATDKKLMADALKLGDGNYEVHFIRRKFTVKTKQQTLIE